MTDKPTLRTRLCEICGTTLVGRQTKYCSNAHRQKAHRIRLVLGRNAQVSRTVTIKHTDLSNQLDQFDKMCSDLLRICNMPSRAGSPNVLPSKETRNELLRTLRSRADEGDSIAIFGTLVIDHLYRESKAAETNGLAKSVS